MTLNIPTVLTIMALLLNSGGAFADGLSVDELLEQRNPASALDNLGLDERETLVLNLVESLKSANDARSLAIGNAFVQVERLDVCWRRRRSPSPDLGSDAEGLRTAGPADVCT
jgi:hypothetical protein